jgi:uncharacterized protein (TIGR01777 family)
MSKTVCITGGSGMIGTALGRYLHDEGYRVLILSRSQKEIEHAEVFSWDISRKEIDRKALETADIIVHLAGASIAGKRWTEEQKKKIRNSRIESTRLLYNTLKELDKKPSAFISMSAIGVYGHNTGGILIDEDRVKPGDDFLATVTREWEEEAGKISSLGMRLVILRTGIVLSMKGGALPRLVTPAKFGLGAPLASGEQYLSWIHIDDLTGIIRFIIENEKVQGIYNAVAPEPETNREFSKKVSKTLNKPFFLPNVPAFSLKLVFGEMASTIIGGNRVSSEKIQKEGFEFRYPTLESALQDLLINEK